MAKLGRASTPVDLLTYEPEDEQPSVFLLRESPRQAILTVFNWTEYPRSHSFDLCALGLSTCHGCSARDLFKRSEVVALEGRLVHIENQPPHSVRMIMLLDTNIQANAPRVHVQVPSTINGGEAFSLSVQMDPGSIPALAYHWDFGDGASAEGPKVTHCYTRPAKFAVQVNLTLTGWKV